MRAGSDQERRPWGLPALPASPHPKDRAAPTIACASHPKKDLWCGSGAQMGSEGHGTRRRQRRPPPLHLPRLLPSCRWSAASTAFVSGPWSLGASTTGYGGGATERRSNQSRGVSLQGPLRRFNPARAADVLAVAAASNEARGPDHGSSHASPALCFSPGRILPATSMPPGKKGRQLLAHVSRGSRGPSDEASRLRATRGDPILSAGKS